MSYKIRDTDPEEYRPGGRRVQGLGQTGVVLEVLCGNIVFAQPEDWML